MTVEWPPQRVIELVKTGDGDSDWYGELSWMWTEQSQMMLDLVRSIVTDGIREPIDIAISTSDELRLMDGHHRIAVALALSLETVPVNFWIERDPDEDDEN